MTNLIAVILASLALIVQVQASIADSRQTIEHPDKAEYRAAVPHSDKHKFGYELGENKHFHHTTTDEDGVRLGCYGHVLEGKKYSTQYVADMKGYRPVYTQDLITVYPKSGGERKASFIREFSEDEKLSQNIRFFFPDGCQSKPREDLAPAESVNVPVIVRAPITTTRRATTLATTTTRTTEAPSTCPKPKCTCTCV